VAQLMGHVTTTTTQRYVGWTPDAKAVIRGMFGGDAAWGSWSPGPGSATSRARRS
jgi:hypothetical protein